MIEIKHLSKTFQMKDGAVNALKDINLTIPDGRIRLHGSACRRCGHWLQQDVCASHAASYSPKPIRDSGQASPTEPYAARL